MKSSLQNLSVFVLFMGLVQTIWAEAKNHSRTGAASKATAKKAPSTFTLRQSIDATDLESKKDINLKVGTVLSLVDNDSSKCDFWEVLISVAGKEYCAPTLTLSTGVNLKDIQTKDVVIFDSVEGFQVEDDGGEDPKYKLTSKAYPLKAKSLVKIVSLPTDVSPCPAGNVLVQHLMSNVEDPSTSMEIDSDKFPLLCVPFKWFLRGAQPDKRKVSADEIKRAESALHKIDNPTHEVSTAEDEPPPPKKETPPPTKPKPEAPSKGKPVINEIRKLKTDISAKSFRKGNPRVPLVAGTRIKRLASSAKKTCEKGFVLVQVVKLNEVFCISNKDFLQSTAAGEAATEPNPTTPPSKAKKDTTPPVPGKLKNLKVAIDGHMSSLKHSEPQYYLDERAEMGQRIRTYYSEDEKDPYQMLAAQKKNNTSTGAVPKLKHFKIPSDKRVISQSFANALDANLEGCIKKASGVESLTDIEVSHIGIGKDARHNSKSLHAIGRAMDMTGIYFKSNGKTYNYVLSYGNMARMKAEKDRNSIDKQQYSFWVSFSDCMKGKGFKTRTFDKTHPKHVHVSLPSQSLTENYGFWPK